MSCKFFKDISKSLLQCTRLTKLKIYASGSSVNGNCVDAITHMVDTLPKILKHVHISLAHNECDGLCVTRLVYSLLPHTQLEHVFLDFRHNYLSEEGDIGILNRFWPLWEWLATIDSRCQENGLTFDSRCNLLDEVGDWEEDHEDLLSMRCIAASQDDGRCAVLDGMLKWSIENGNRIMHAIQT